MKTTLRLGLILTVIALCSNVSAQTPKWAHINLQELILSMPEYDSAMVKLQKFGQELEQFLEEMQVEWNRKMEDYSKNQANWSDLVKQAKTDELTTMQQRIQTSQQQAEENYQQEYNKLLQPVMEKANKAVETVAKEQGITYVISDNPQVLIFKATGTTDLLPAVQKNLGIAR